MPLTIKDRTLAHFTQGKARLNIGTKQLEQLTLEDVRDYLIKLDRAQKPHDVTRSLDKMVADFTGQTMQVTWKVPLTDNEAGKLLVTSTGASQLARLVLPAHFFSGLKAEIALGSQGEKLAAMNWNFFGNYADADQFVRSVCMKVNGEVRRVIRSAHSKDYAPYANLKFVQDLLDNAGEFAQLPILDWYLTDDYMRLRFHAQSDAVKNGRLQMVECWNSETGCRRIGMRGGVFFPSTGAGLTHWDERHEKSWYHRGDPKRIANSVQSTFNEMLKVSAEVLADYEKALAVEIDNAYEWMLAELQAHISEQAMSVATGALPRNQVTAGGTLASVVDAVLLASLAESSVDATYEVERAAARALSRGLSEAQPVTNKDDGSLNWMIEAA